MIVPVLVDVLLTDKKPAVRAEAAQSLGKIRPVSQQVGLALEQALSSDASMRVRLQARSSLLQYHWSGYHGSKKDEMISQTKEPPLADDKTLPSAISTAPQPPTTSRLAPVQPDGSRSTSGYRPSTPAPFPQVPPSPTGKEPPLAPPTPPASPAPTGKEPPPAPMPSPTPPANPAPPSAPGGNESGPDLTPP
jgi:hypothetical protein